ncbi:glycoside hydrolase family 36 protein [Deinococcus sp. QL22]|uniref:glycoside hydrolase family 36 protein n=1 Tax=Deinococcus sp. QL22 TaxID=2939437 RepID=UPI0020177209|nr:glycoside hydrolase family 36 protein [Deinococcus sp. QL22]UQN09892.1 alpha-galactosidase [Deinococcus sp. QL22]
MSEQEHNVGEWVLDVRPEEIRALVSGFQSWSEAELRPLTDLQAVPVMKWRHEQGHDPAFLPSGEAGVWRSHTVLALVRPDGGGWVGCALDATHTFTHWEARVDQGANGQQVRVTCTGEGPAVEVVWQDTADVIGTVETLSAQLGSNMNALTPPPLRVWCSWYSYYRGVTLENMLENARLARQHSLPFDVFQLDDGFQADLGDWFEPSSHFGGHAKELPARLQQLGFTPGIWLAPFLASPTSRLFRDHPDWMLRGEDGLPLPVGHNWGGAYYTLDTTHPEVLAWLRELSATVRGWGYTYLKLDFLYGAALPGVRHDPSVGRAQAYRNAMQALRDGAPDAFILACGAPLAGSIGLVDAMRTGPDVAPYWDEESRRVWLGDATGPSARNALHTALSRWYQHSWYQPDPDVAIVRRELSLLNHHEREAVAGMLDIIGGLRASSDPIFMLDEDGLNLLRRCLTLSTPDRPTTLTQSFGGAVTHFSRGMFNLTDQSVTSLPAHAYLEQRL